MRELVRGHASGRKRRDFVAVVHAADADDVELIRRVVQGAVERAVVADGRDHDDAVGDDLVDLLDEREVEVVRTADGEVDDVHLGGDGVVERV